MANQNNSQIYITKIMAKFHFFFLLTFNKDHSIAISLMSELKGCDFCSDSMLQLNTLKKCSL